MTKVICVLPKNSNEAYDTNTEIFHIVRYAVVCIFGSPYFGYLIIIRGVIWKDDDGEEEDDDEGNE